MTPAIPTQSGKEGASPRPDNGCSVGNLLKSARERRGLTLDDISRETKIAVRHLQALEHDLPTQSAFYRRAQIRAYARVVHLDEALVFAQLDQASEPAPEASAAVSPPPAAAMPLVGDRSWWLAAAIAAVAIVGMLVGRATVSQEARSPGRAVTGYVSDRASDSLPAPKPSDRVVATSLYAQSPAVVHDEQAPPGAVPLLNESTEPRARSAADAARSEPAAQLTSTPTVPKGPADLVEPSETRTSGESATELVVSSLPRGARVTVDGIGWGEAPVRIRYLPPGEKHVRLSMEGYASEERIVRLTDGESKTLNFGLRPAVP